MLTDLRAEVAHGHADESGHGLGHGEYLPQLRRGNTLGQYGGGGSGPTSATNSIKVKENILMIGSRT